jgi:membrane-bound acyltransferase YfiQ involved in biofilm formation
VREHYQGLLEKLSRPISMVSAYTFTIYLLHFPILIFLANFTTQTAVVVPVCFVVLILLGMQAELGKKSIAEFLTRFAPK